MYQQQYHQYTIQQQQTWNILYTKRAEALSATVSAPFWAGIDALELKAYFIPDLQKINFLLKRLMGWEVVAVEEALRPRQVLARWAQKKLPVVANLREKPDINSGSSTTDLFHNAFGFLPWMLQPEVADFMQRVGQLSVQVKDPAATELLWRLAQHLLGNGLIRDGEGKVTLLGANLVANGQAAAEALRRENAWHPIVLEEILGQPFKEEESPEVYFVLEGWEDLTRLIDQLEKEGVPLVEIPAQWQALVG
ncbi:hypothetical protein ACD591_03600 [Rufibacter glacialis]|uniref:Biopterin-dependent aromatic amino acid hydroxylase family profile domain-containing protein n=1 Tax=Rufibacter glacialis TaxID=1259555 RepID=A0A5M8QI00_9BACT|nr:hypothetical protein [Rufibacter glacialis]KAA6434453.1 hypothetical protein FOE74_09670 [Rufibacter glacialis]GGK69758.1 phenylalanine-4-hydroxylase [Rufibacter glacialis]